MTSEIPTSLRRPAHQAANASNLLDDPVEGGQDPSQSLSFDVTAAYRRYLIDDDTPMPIAAVLALTELLSVSKGKILTRTWFFLFF